MYHFLKKKVEWICGNGIAEIGKKNCDKLIVVMPIRKQGEKKNFVAMALPK